MKLSLEVETYFGMVAILNYKHDGCLNQVSQYTQYYSF